MSEKKNNPIPLPEEYVTLGISCPSKQFATEVTYERSAISDNCPNGKHRWSYKCQNEDGEKGATMYTEWICD